jgi:hypothetical protein
MADKEVKELAELMRLTAVGVYEASARAGIAPSNWSRWRGHGVSPNLSKFGKLRSAVTALAVESGRLPEGCEHKSVPELIELAKGWRV